MKAKRNDIVAVEYTTSSTTSKFSTEIHHHYFLAKATRVTREGIVKEFIKANGSIYKTSPFTKVLVINGEDLQSAARELFSSSCLDFKDMHAIKDAILETRKKFLLSQKATL